MWLGFAFKNKMAMIMKLSINLLTLIKTVI